MRILPELVGFGKTKADLTEVPTHGADEIMIDDVGDDNVQPRACVS